MSKRIAAAVLIVVPMVVGVTAPQAGAAPIGFGAKLTTSSQPTGSEKCDQNGDIPDNATCTWVATTAFENGDHFKAPRDGTIKTVKLISCQAGSFVLQIARAKPSLGQAKVVRNGPTIHYAADPFVSDGNPETFCGGDDGVYVIQSFPVNVPVKTGDFIAAKAKRLGFIHNSGGGNTFLFAPPLAPGGPFENKDDESSADLMLRLIYG